MLKALFDRNPDKKLIKAMGLEAIVQKYGYPSYQ
jgi:hypothetical protein